MKAGRKKGYKDPNAWINSPQAEEVVAFYAEGHSIKETAEHFGVKPHQVGEVARRRRISNGLKPYSYLTVAKVANDAKVAKAEKRLVERLTESGFEYLGGYTNKDSKFRVRCLKCGAERERTASFIYTRTTPVCLECQKRETRERENARRQTKQVENEKRKRVNVCDVCGIKFITYNSQQKRCSSECKRIFRNQGRKRLTETNIIDKNITLPRLYKRDGGFCHICGLKCNWEDKDIREDGIVIYGSTYPTIDHVFPLAKGGKHSWENVKLAHWVCNIRKSDAITDAIADGTEVITSGRTLPKKTLQYDIEGNLIHVYSSTVEAAKVTGFKRKQIQNCARGEKPTYRGFVWKYA